MSKNTIICPHCKQETTVIAYYKTGSTKHYKGPVIFFKDYLDLDKNNQTLLATFEGEPDVEYCVCEKCHKDLDWSKIRKLWKAREKADNKPKSRKGNQSRQQKH